MQYNDFEIQKEYISLEYDNKDQFTFKSYSYEEAVSLIKETDKSTHIKDIKKFILKNSIIKSNPQQEEPKKQSPYQEDKDESSKKKENENIIEEHIQIINTQFEQNQRKEIINS